MPAKAATPWRGIICRHGQLLQAFRFRPFLLASHSAPPVWPRCESCLIQTALAQERAMQILCPHPSRVAENRA